MVFWGVEVKPGEHFTPNGDEYGEYEGCRLHLSQATLGLDAKGKERTVVKCKVGDVVGSRSVHLVGYYMPLDDDDEEDSDYEFEGSSEDDLDDLDYDVNSDMEDIVGLTVPPSSVTITEIDCDATPLEGRVQNKQLLKSNDEDKKAANKRKRDVSLKEKKQFSKQVDNVAVEEASDDEDGFPRPTAKTEIVNGFKEVSTGPTSSDDLKKSKKDKNEKVAPPQVRKEKSQQTADEAPNVVPKESTFESKSSTTTFDSGTAITPRTGSTGKKVKKGGPVVRKFPNGLEIEDIAMGRPDARQTKIGKMVNVHYTGRLKSNGKIFDSSIGKKPFAFRLGVGEVVKGWDVGVTGMRIGDKRRITIPPAMGYGSKNIGTIPANSWLVFDVEVVAVSK